MHFICIKFILCHGVKGLRAHSTNNQQQSHQVISLQNKQQSKQQQRQQQQSAKWQTIFLKLTQKSN